VFLLVYDSCTGHFVVTFLYMHTVDSHLAHSLQYSPSSSTPLLKMPWTGFNVPYS
jgi:hypothetical protein